LSARSRAPLAALVAFLIGGELAARGPALLLEWSRYAFPYLWLFLLLELVRALRRLGDGEAFLIAAAVGLLHDGVYAKALQEGSHAFVGIDVLGALGAVCDWGMLGVLSLHVVDAVRPVDGRGRRPGLPEAAALGVIALGAAARWGVDAWSGRWRLERFLGSGWLLADALFVLAALGLLGLALERGSSERPPARERWQRPLLAAWVWLPGTAFLGRLGRYPSVAAVVLVAAWSAVVWKAARKAVEDPPAAPVHRSRLLLGAAAWRLIGCAAVYFWYGPAEPGTGAPFVVYFLVDLPTRAAFARSFFRARAAV
jgi:hypothetical protein